VNPLTLIQPFTKKRFLYVLLFGIPGIVWSLLAAAIIFAALSGFLWLFVYGDRAWPQAAGSMLPVAFLLVFLAACVVFMVAGYLFGKKLEAQPGLDRRHVVLSIGATVLPVALLILQQFSVGNIGPQPDGVVCADFCLGKGWSGSGMPPQDTGERTCFCLDGHGREVDRISLDSINR
jgi:hypothetical protein